MLDTATPLTMVLAETTGTDTIYYLHGLGLVAQSDGVSTEYFVNDGLGSVRQLVDPVGEVLLAQTYDPYGSLYASAGVDSPAFGYAGEQEDANGLVFLRARYYSPSTGRFLNMDPSHQEMNPYQYATSNPINGTDPFGTHYCEAPMADPDECTDLVDVPTQFNDDVTQVPLWWDHTGQHKMEFEPSTFMRPTDNQYAITEDACSKNTCGIQALAAISLNLPSKGFSPKDIYDQLGLCLDKEFASFSQIGGLAEDFGYKQDRFQPLPATAENFYDEVRTRLRRTPIEYAIILVGYDSILNGVTVDTIGQWRSWVSGCKVDMVETPEGPKCPAGQEEYSSNGHFIVIAGLSTQTYWGKGADWQWVKIYDPEDNQLEYYLAQTIFDWMGSRNPLFITEDPDSAPQKPE